MSANEQPSSLVASITFLTGPLAGTTAPITRTVITIGRDETNDIVVKGDQQISRRHARLVWVNGAWVVENISGHNWIAVNQQQVQQSYIQDQAVISLGKGTTFVFNLRAVEPTPPPQPQPVFSPPPQANWQQPPPAQGGPAYPPAPGAYGSGEPAGGPPAPGAAAYSAPPPAYPALSNAAYPPGGAPGGYAAGAPPVSPGAPGGYGTSAPPASSGAPVFSAGGPGAPPVSPGAPGGYGTGALPATGSGDGLGTVRMARPSRTIVASPLKLGVATLEVSDNTTGQRRGYPLDKKTLSIGRDPANDIVIDERCISGQHLLLEHDGNQTVLIHPHPARQQTTHGLLYQGRRIRGDESFRKPLVSGDVFRISDESGTLVTLTYHDGTGKEADDAPAVRPIRLDMQELTIGRKEDNTVVLPHPLVSAHHAKLVREGGAYRILDLHSTNHVYVNGELVTSHLLKLGDEIRIGSYRLVYESTHLTQYDETKSIRIDAQNLRKTGANGATLLNNISLSIPPRSFVALVGGSGAGKSTLMDALSGLRRAHEGKVFYNGQDYYANLAAFNTQIGYVPQDDIVHRDLTVERALYYAAKMRLPKDFTGQQIWQRIAEVLDDVEMTARRKLLIKKLSGGQRKRVSIALELLANPGLFFLDEPTSGLDPGLDRKMMVLLRKLADKGHTIILVTHATNNITVCDYVCFLAAGGRVAYFGPPDGAKTHFGKTDFAEIYSALEINPEQPTAPEEAEARFKVSPEYQQYITKPLQEATHAHAPAASARDRKRVKRGGAFSQFWLLSQRRLELLRNDVPTLMILLLEALLVSLLLVVLIRVETTPDAGSGTSVLAADNVIQCQPLIRLSPALAQQLNNQQGVLVVTGVDANKKTVNCGGVRTFLQNDVQQGQPYAAARGGVDKALQDFEVAGNNGNSQRLVFMLVLIPIMFGNIFGSREIIKEIPIYRRERAVSLGIVPYLLSKIIVFSVMAIIQAAEVVIVVEIFEPFGHGQGQAVLFQGGFAPVLEAFITLSLSAIAGLLWGYLVSVASPNEDTANSLIAGVVVPPVIFSGTILSMNDSVSQIIAMIFPLRWGMAALGTSQGLHSDLLGNDHLFGKDLLYHPQLFSTFTQTESSDRLILSWVVLGVITVVTAVIVGILLKQKDKVQ